MSAIPHLTIGLPVFNGEEFLGDALDALLSQSYTNFELIISDNASTDGTAEICRSYEKRDSRIRCIRQRQQIGMVANHNFLVGLARGELFKWASHDDLYAPEYLEQCVAALEDHPEAVLAHSWCILMDACGDPIELITYPEATGARHATERLRSMLFDGKGDWIYSVMRTATLRQTPLHGTYHGGERTLITEFALHGALHQIPDPMFYRRDHPGRHLASRDWSIRFDPARDSRLRHPAARLYGEYLWGYVSAIRRAPLTRAQKRDCYALLARWLITRAVPDRQSLEEPASLGQQPLLYVLRSLTGLLSIGSKSAQRKTPPIHGLMLERVPSQPPEVNAR
jgi:glycosyltransferase involved in cell wall biosynthesis